MMNNTKIKLHYKHKIYNSGKKLNKFVLFETWINWKIFAENFNYFFKFF